MKQFTTFARLRELSKAMLPVENNVKETYNTCWQQTNHLIDTITQDIELLFNTSCFVIEAKYIIEDYSYRQGANVVKFEIRFQEDKELIIVVECLIDLERIWLKVKSRPASTQFDYIADKIERNYNGEFVADIKQIS